MQKSAFTILLRLSLCLSLFSCNPEVDVSNIPYEPKIVVEGSIEIGEYASVFISRSAPVLGKHDTIGLLEYARLFPRVIVIDNETLVADTLRMTINRNRIPPYENRGRVIKGEIGKHYTLKIEYDGKIITSTTYIPAPVALDEIWFRRRKANDTLGYIGVSFKNESAEYYRLATSSVSVRGVFTPCLYGNIDSRKYENAGQIKLELNKGPTVYPRVDFSTFYNISDTVKIKFSTQPKAAYDYWVSYQNEVLNSQNVIYPAFSNLKTNIDGGIGIWSGYGSLHYTVILSNIEKKD